MVERLEQAEALGGFGLGEGEKLERLSLELPESFRLWYTSFP